MFNVSFAEKLNEMQMHHVDRSVLEVLKKVLRLSHGAGVTAQCNSNSLRQVKEEHPRRKWERGK